MENKSMRAEEIEIDLGEIFHVLLSRAVLILSVGVCGALLVFLVTGFILPPIYESTTKVYILNKQDNTAVTYNDVQVGTQLTKDYAELVKSRFVLEEVIQKLGLPMTYEELEKKLNITTPTDTRILSIGVEDESPVTAMDIANAIRETAAVHITNVMDIEAVNVVETANLPLEKSKPNVLQWTLIGGLAGALLMGILVLARYMLDDTVKSSEDVEKYLQLSTLAMIPIVEPRDGARNTKEKKVKKKKPEGKQKTEEGKEYAGSKIETA